ncbi:Chloroperoxidase [Pisolithus orientalis]|uniref:Chloroperoxidase n=1 Tax=Pisolithus orientalis TaxID=936130 RepID=UPI002224960B|nr:Chloroperoxidase [Pisolithus orientalis]KAI6015105.1 Chloroperoxidase [Pisolithus orientalis]
MGSPTILYKTFYYSGILIWDITLSLFNLVLFKRPVGKVVPEGNPGYAGNWPEYKPPQEGESRCSCPAINAMANHGIISRSGRGIKFTDLTRQVRTTYNFSASFCSFVPHYAAFMLNKSYSKDTFDLEELDLHNGIEHDASLTRLDAALQPDQSKVHRPFIEDLFSFATGKDQGQRVLTTKDLSRFSGKRRAGARATNPMFTLDLSHKLFGSTNTATLLTAFGGRVDDLRAFLLEERLPQGWEPRVRYRCGLTIFTFNQTIVPLELRIRESDWEGEASGVGEDN